MRPFSFIWASAVLLTAIATTCAVAQVTQTAAPSTSNVSIPARSIQNGPFVIPAPPRSGGATPFPAGTPAVLYVLAVGGDAPTRQKFVSYLAQSLQYAGVNLSVAQPDNEEAQQQVQVVVEPDWGISDYTSACQLSHDQAQVKTTPTPDSGKSAATLMTPTPSEASAGNDIVAGALIVNVDQVSAWTKSVYVWKTNFTSLYATLSYSVCDTTNLADQPTPKPEPAKTMQTRQRTIAAPKTSVTINDYAFSTPKPSEHPPYYLAWSSQVRQGSGHQGFITPLPLVGLMLSGVAAWSAFTPSVTKATMNTTQFATPVPGSTIPPGGLLTTSVTNNSKISNAAQLSTVANSFLASSINYDTALSPTLTNDQTANSAVRYIVNVFLNSELRCPPSEASYYATDDYTVCYMILTRRNNGKDGPTPSPPPAATPSSQR